MNIFNRLVRAVHNATAPRPDAATAERYRLAALPRYQETVTNLPGVAWRVPDGPSFLASWQEIFDRGIYNFVPGPGPIRILDCGANVGVSCLYFHQRFPQAKITAFEPDPKIFEYLESNLASSGCREIELVRKAVWSVNTTLQFHSEGADGGRVEAGDGKDHLEIPAVRLRDFLDQPVSMLKLDIEGAETEVIKDIAPCLPGVQNIFVEYHSFESKPQSLVDILQILKEAGYRIYLQPVHGPAQPFVAVNSHMGMDLQLNIFGRRGAPN